MVVAVSHGVVYIEGYVLCVRVRWGYVVAS